MRWRRARYRSEEKAPAAYAFLRPVIFSQKPATASIAVPFAGGQADTTVDELADGITEGIIDTVSH
jgi:TolB-like protein